MTRLPRPDPVAREGIRASWASIQRDGQGRVSWLGVLLVLVGAALFINQLNRSIDVGSVVLLALGVACAAGWLIRGYTSATVPALALTALGIAGLGNGLGYLEGPGWAPLAVGGALVVAWALGPLQKRSRPWALWLGLILGVYGLARVSSVLLPGVPDLPWLGPAVLIGIGVALLVRRRAPRGF